MSIFNASPENKSLHFPNWPNKSFRFHSQSHLSVKDLNVRSMYFLRTLKPPHWNCPSSTGFKLPSARCPHVGGRKTKPFASQGFSKSRLQEDVTSFSKNTSPSPSKGWWRTPLCICGRGFVCHNFYCCGGLLHHPILLRILRVQVVHGRRLSIFSTVILLLLLLILLLF